MRIDSVRRSVAALILLAGFLWTPATPAAFPQDRFAQAREHAGQFERAVAASRRLLQAWLNAADPKTLLLPDRLDVDPAQRVYTPHNSGADLYPYLILTAHLTDPSSSTDACSRCCATKFATRLRAPRFLAT